MNSKDAFNAYISYAWDKEKDKVHELYDKLKDKYTIWIDKNEMDQGNVVSIMKNGIDISTIFICCVTQEYFTRINTMTEYYYACGIEKPILYVIAEDLSNDIKYKELISTYGFIGFEMDNQLYFKVNEFDNIEKAIEKMLNNVVRIWLSFI